MGVYHNKLKCSPPPWSIEKTKDYNASYRVMDGQGITVALCYQKLYDTCRAKYNANLIAQAPQLFEDLNYLIDVCESEGMSEMVLSGARETLAKALGKKPKRTKRTKQNKAGLR